MAEGEIPNARNRDTVTGQRPKRALSFPYRTRPPFFSFLLKTRGSQKNPNGTSEDGARHDRQHTAPLQSQTERQETHARERETTPPLRIGHLLRANLERSRSTNEGRQARRSAHTRTGSACGTANQPNPSTGSGRKAEQHGGSQRETPPTPQRTVPKCEEGREGSDRMTAPLPSTHHQRAGRRSEGPAGRTRRAAAIRHECPSLAWRGFGSGPKRVQQHHIDPNDA